MKYTLHFLLSMTLFLFGCNASKKITDNTPTVEFENLDTMVISAPKIPVVAEDYKLPPYRKSFHRKSDLIHTKLDLNFDWAKQQVIGVADLTFTPYFHPSNEVSLDAVGFTFNKITMNGKDLKYDYDGKIVTIQLGKTFTRGQEYKIKIDYIAEPAKSATEKGGAITSDQGLFFINHDGKDPNKPMQIWTQGETENNSRWFPTVDKPNERCTQELTLTVDDKYKTLSNGVLTSSKKNGNGTRTDSYKMELPHAPYLFMIAVGEFEVVTEKWNGIDIEYYVEPDYKSSAKKIFNHTPEMLTFFSEKLGVPYPWAKYSQVVVRDFVSGAMENTTGVIFGEFVQKDERELLDGHNDRIVAHELFHHWFGDYVTCESWANLTMNEGFANYGEYLWFEYKYGVEYAAQHLMNEQRGYIGSAAQNMHDLIDFEYRDKEDMFDAHSYNKGGSVLHMLRNYVGDDAFWTSLNKYLKDNAYSAVEAHDLRLAFEAVTGEDLNWFFNQWYFESGHHVLDIQYGYDEGAQKAMVTVEQKQDPDRSIPIFVLPVAIDVYDQGGNKTRHHVTMDKRKQTFSFDSNEAPALINFDGDKMLLCEKIENKSDDNLVFQYFHSDLFRDKFDALYAVGDQKTTASRAMLVDALQNPFWGIRKMALDKMKKVSDEGLNEVVKIATDDPQSQVRAAALKLLGKEGRDQDKSIIKNALLKDKSYTVISEGIRALFQLDKGAALEVAEQMQNEKSSQILGAVGSMYAMNADEKYIPFFENNWNNLDGYDAIEFLGNYLGMVKQTNENKLVASLGKLKGMALDVGNSPWRRLGATKAMSDLRNNYNAEADSEMDDDKKDKLRDMARSITDMVQEIKTKETNDQLKEVYQNF